MLSNNNKRIKLVLIFIFLLSLHITLPSKTDLNLVNNLTGDLKSFKSAIFELHKMEKKAIPLLIKEMNCKKKVNLLLTNPRESNLSSDLWEKCSGILSAYVVEMIIAREKIDKKNLFECNSALGSDLVNYIYYHGIIKRNNGGNIQESDMSRIKTIYEIWWKKNKHKSIEQLRKEWKENKRPLSGSKYHWE